jgi:hypothetical protein
MAYVELADLKIYLGIAADNVSQDDLLSDFIAEAQSAIDRLCKTTFEAASDTTRYFDAELDINGRELPFDHDLAQITSVTNGDGELIPASDYTTNPRNEAPYYAITLKRAAPSYWTWDDSPEDAIEVVGRWAYSVTAPADVALACKQLAAHYYRKRANSSGFDRHIVTADGRVLEAAVVPAEVMGLLRSYIDRLTWR